MLSGETAAGKYPIESVKSMNSIVWEADQIHDAKRTIEWSDLKHDSKHELDSLAYSAVQSARDMEAKLIIVITMTGNMAKAVAKYRPNVPILAYCTDPQVARRLQLYRAVKPMLLQSVESPSAAQTSFAKLRAETVRTAKELGYVRSGELVIMVDRTVGRDHDLHAYSHNMKIVTVRDN
jgi:pyruvate kinase